MSRPAPLVAAGYARRRFAAILVLPLLALSFARAAGAPPPPSQANGALAAAAELQWQAEQLADSGNSARAAEALAHVLKVYEENLGRDSVEVAILSERLAALHAAQRRHGDAATLLRRAIAINEKTGGPGLDQRLKKLAAVEHTRARYLDAEGAYQRALTIQERELARNPPQGATDVATTLRDLAALYVELGRYGDAEALYRRTLSLYHVVYGAMDVEIARTHEILASLYVKQGQYTNAESSLQYALRVWERHGGTPEGVGIANTLVQMGDLYTSVGRYGPAEAFLNRALEIREASLPPGDPLTLDALQRLIGLYLLTGRVEEARPLYWRGGNLIFGVPRDATPDETRTLVADRLNAVLAGRAWHPQLPDFVQQTGDFWRARGNVESALRDYDLATSLREVGLGREHPEVAKSLIASGRLHLQRGNVAQAATLFERALRIREKALGRDHPDVADTLHHLAGVYHDRKDLAAAINAAKRAISIKDRAAGPESPAALGDMALLTGLLMVDRQWTAAREIARRFVDTLEAIARNDPDIGESPAREFYRARSFDVWHYGHARLLIRAAADDPTAFDEAFALSDRQRNRAVQAALVRAGARAAIVDPATADLARRVQDLRYQVHALREQLLVEQARPSADRASDRLEELRRQRTRLDLDLGRATAALETAFPKYAALTTPAPMTLQAIRRLLHPDEALISYTTFDKEVLIWFVKPDTTKYHFAKIERAQLATLIASVRRGLDQSGNPAISKDSLTPVDVAGNHRLYTLLLVPFTTELAGVRHLIVVPDETLLPIPFGALITSADGDDYRRFAMLHASALSPAPDELARYRNLSWLIKDYAITVVPSAIALRALRDAPRTKSTKVEPLIAFGDPVLEGTGAQRGGMMRATRGATPVDELRKLDRLPGTRGELLAVAGALGADPSTALYLDQNATKPVVMRLDREGRLAQAAVVAFATHGLIAGEIGSLTEPALVLTPPAAITEDDNGLLGLAEVLSLNLDNADWVILSACNTAAADRTGEGLSGLVRAFFFAGARSLLVSHWSVEDQATRTLMSKVFQRYAREPTLPRAEALRRGMIALMDQANADTAYFAHPFAWAPFFLVGEGNVGGAK